MILVVIILKFLQLCFFQLDIGFIANAIAVPILLSKQMSNVFNRLLASLSVIDNVFIVCSILEAIRKHIGNKLTLTYSYR